MHCSWAPIARWIRSAATELSTPPESPQMTRPLPTVWRMVSSASAAKPFIVQLPLSLQLSKRKERSISLPRGVWTTSGWNCTP